MVLGCGFELIATCGSWRLWILLTFFLAQATAVIVSELHNQMDIIEDLQSISGFLPQSGVSYATGLHHFSKALVLSGNTRQLKLPKDLYKKAFRLMTKSNEFTILATFRQQPKNSGTILAIADGNQRFMEVQSSGRRDELRFQYIHRGEVHIETFHYPLADHSWHKIALTVSGNLVELYVDCVRVAKRLILDMDRSTKDLGDLTLWLGQRGPSHFLFKGLIQDVKLIGGKSQGYLIQCPQLDSECPSCGQFREVQTAVRQLENYIKDLTQRLEQAENKIASLEDCECAKTCSINGSIHPDGATWKQGCEICSCVHGQVECRPVQCVPPTCKNPVLLDGECCPTCLKQCFLRGVLYDDGELVSPRQCVQCKCQDGSMQCRRIDPESSCPTLTCPEHQQFSVPGECCRYCPGTDYCSQGHTCHTNATCINLQTRATCQCNEGYFGDGKSCQDINECSKEGGHDGHHCRLNTKCSNIPGSYECQCLPGFKRVDAYNCAEYDECTASDHDCDSNAKCLNTRGSYKCQCKDGYTGDGFTCQPICREKCMNGGRCIAPDTCACQRGYTGISCEEDIDECSLGLHLCKNNARCQNMPGWYYCDCLPGYQSVPTQDNSAIVCQDIDECLLNEHTCHDSMTCINEQGSFRCECNNVTACSQSCMYESTVRENGERWSSGSSCSQCHCHDGVVTCDALTCDCSNPSMDVGCCPQCDKSSKCTHQEISSRTYSNGEQWIYQCQMCECMYGEVDCWEMACPPVQCSNPVIKEDDCCPRCEDDPCTSSPLNSTGPQLGCAYNGYSYQSGEKVLQVQDPCTSCKCQNGRLCCAYNSECLAASFLQQQGSFSNHSKDGHLDLKPYPLVGVPTANPVP